MMATLEDGIAYSRWERSERNKPKPIEYDENGDVIVPDEPDPEDETVLKPLIETEMICRPVDYSDVVKAQVNRYNRHERCEFDKFIIKMSDSSYLQIEAAGLTPEELALAVTARISSNDTTPLTPVAIQIEGAGDFKTLLTEGIEPEDGTLPRQWSLWKTTDPVALIQGEVKSGLPDQACHYANNVFVFSSEENLKLFMANPRAYLEGGEPKMPEDYRLMITGPRGSGFHT
jgi:hypothetical protein